MALQEAENLKVEGNAMFHEGRYKDALRSYFKALQKLSLQASNATESIPSTSCDVSSRLHGNIGACYLKLGRFEMCMGECQCARGMTKDPDFVRKLHRRYWEAASRLFLGTLNEQDAKNVGVWVVQASSVGATVPNVIVEHIASLGAANVDLNILKTCSKLFQVASKFSFLEPCDPPGIITSVESDPAICELTTLVYILVMVGFPPTTLISDQKSKDSTRGREFPLISSFIDEAPRCEFFLSLEQPIRVPCIEFVQSWLTRHSPPMDIRHCDGLSPVDTTMINLCGIQTDIEVMEADRKDRGSCGSNLRVNFCPFGPGCEGCLRRSLECAPTKRNLHAHKREVTRHQSLLEVLCSYGYRSTFTAFTPGNSIFHGGKEALMHVDTFYAQDHRIRRSCWKSYEDILKSLGEPIARKLCHVCRSTGGRACSGCPQDEGPIYCSIACQHVHWEAGHRDECALAKPLCAICILHWKDEGVARNWQWMRDEAGPSVRFSASSDLPDGCRPHQVPSKMKSSFVLRVDIPVDQNLGRPPMFACDKERVVNCFIDPDSEVYLPLLQLVRQEGSLFCRVYVLAKISHDAALKVATRTTSAW